MDFVGLLENTSNMERFSLFFVALFFLVSLSVAYGTEEEKMKSKSGHEEMCRADSEGSQCSEKHESKADEAENENLRRKNFQSDEVDDISELKKERSEEEIEEELKQTQSEEQEYLKGSACSYCTYCKVFFRNCFSHLLKFFSTTTFRKCFFNPFFKSSASCAIKTALVKRLPRSLIVECARYKEDSYKNKNYIIKINFNSLLK